MIKLHFSVIAHRPTPDGDVDVTQASVLSQDALIKLLRLHKVPERFWSVGYHRDDEFAYHFSPIPKEGMRDDHSQG
jgi:hypothetical protein